MNHEHVAALAARIRHTAMTEFPYTLEENRDVIVGDRLDLADELDAIAHEMHVEAYHRNEMMFA